MDRKLKILVLEDVQTDFELMELQLEKENISFISKRVETKEDFKKELKDFAPDIILSNYSLPQFDGLSALKMAKEQTPDIPFIIVTGSMKEETAVTTMKAGAWDYVMKDKLIRLGPAVGEVLKLKGEIEKRKQAENRIVHLNSVLGAIRNVNQLVVVEKDRDRLLRRVCDVLIETRGYNAAWIGFSGDEKTFSVVKGSGFKPGVSRFIKQVISGNHPHCIKKALAQKEKFLIIDKSRMCGDCFFKDACINKETAVIRIEHAGRLLGLLAILLTPGISIDDEERALLQEVVGDIAFAINDMEIEKRRKQAESQREAALKALQESEQELNAIFNGARDGIALLDKTGKILRINKYIVEIGGYTEEEIVGNRFIALKMFPLKSRSKMITVFGKLLKGQEITYEVEANTKKGEKKIVEISNSLLKKDGKVEGVVAILRDITEHKRVEEVLRASEEKYRTLTENINVGIYRSTVGPKGKYLEVNPAMFKIFGYKSREEFLAITPAEIYQDPKERARFSEKMLRDGFVEMEELQLKRKDGSLVICSTTAIAVKDKNRKVVYYDGIVEDITEHKQMEKTLRESEEKYHSLIESSEDIIYLINRDLKYVYANKKFLLRLKKSESQVFGHGYEEFHSREEVKLFSEKIEKIFKSGNPITYKYQSQRDGRNFIRTLCPIINKETGEVTSVTVISKDVTEIRQTEEKMLMANERLQHLLYSSTTVIYSCETSGDYGITYSSENVFIVTGYLSFNFIKDPKFWIEHIHPEDREFVLEKMSTISKTEILEIEYRFQKKEGEYIWLHDTKKLIRDEHGTPVEIVGSLMNVTERKQAVKALEESENNFRALVENSFDGIMINDIRGNYLYSNKSAAEISGYSIDELLKLNVKDLTPSGDVKKVMERIKNRIENRTSPSYFEGACVQKDGKEIQLEITAAKTTWKGILAEIISMRDITERKQLEQQLLQSQKMETVGNLAGGIAHDFNNLLTIIQGHAQMMQMDIGEDDPNYHRIRQIINASTRAANLTRQLLLFSRKQMMEFLPLNLNDTITKLLKMLQRLIGENIDIQANLQSDLWTVNADESNIEQVVMNICVNARDAMLDGGSLIIKIENIHLSKNECKIIPESYNGHFVRLMIEDTGTGIPRDVIDQIFEPFFSTKEVGKGTGLGLSVVYGIVKKHDGWINVYSELGKGTIFKIYLPVTSKAIGKKTELTIADDAIHGNGERILLIEDEEAVRRFIASALRQYGFIIYEASNASEAWSVFNSERGKFDLIFSDIILPDKNGFDLVEELLSGKKDIPVIMCSGYTEEKVHQSIISKRGFQFIQKPFKMLELLNIISSTISAKEI